MSRNANSRFALVPNINIGRSKFGRHSEIKLSGNVGQIIPIYCDEYLPGDTFEVKTNKVIRLQTLLTPMMDNLYADFYYFSVPYRLVWSHWKELMGENNESAWAPSVEYTVPQITAPVGGWSVGTIADYLGIPIGVEDISVSALPFRAVALVMNDWFRPEQVSDPLYIPVGDTTVVGSNGGDPITDIAKGGKPYLARKFADYFTSALPAPQRGPAVEIPLTNDGSFPVRTSDTISSVTGDPALQWSVRDSNAVVSGPAVYGYGLGIAPDSRNTAIGNVQNSSEAANILSIVPRNLVAVNDGALVGASINSLRMAFQIQKLYERDSYGGRYIEIIKNHFNVTSPDARQQRPEYLGGNRVPINISQVIQQSATDDVSPQGNTAGMSLTADAHFDFRRSFTEHGLVLGFMVLRYDHTYQQGIERFWSRKDRFDFYWPALAHLGEQEIKNKEIFAQGTSADDEVFGYQERWSEYRYKPSRVCGEMRSEAPQSLDSWHLADDYSELPVLSPEWLVEDGSTVDRVLAVSSEVANQFFADLYIQNWSTRPMPVYSVPGLIDHF